ncbi:MAG TPA: ABC transporter ATP-binding protein [bacterium]|nr:ABC transporter ATP-binding protein [bacterium]
MSAKPSYFVRYLREMVLPYPGAIALLTVNVVLRVGLGLWWPYATRSMVDDVLVPALGRAGQFPVPRYALIIGVGFLVLAANFWLAYLFNRLLNRLMTVVTQRARTRLAGRLLRLSQEFYDASHAGRLLTVALQDPANLTQQLTANIINALANALVVLGGYFILVRMSLPLTLAISGVFPLMVLIFFWMQPSLLEQSEKNRESWGILMGMVSEKVNAVRVIRSYATEDAESAAFRARAFLHSDLNVKQTQLRALYGSLNGLCIHLGYLLVFLVGGWLYLNGRTTLGTLVAFNGYFNSLYPAVLQICSLPQLISEASGSLAKVFQLLDRPLGVESPASAPLFEGPLEEVRFEGVWFRYGPGLPWALRDVSLALKAGEQVGVMGPSGSGKSTLMALLLRFYDVERGRILVNGRDLRDWDLGSLRRSLGLVPQEPVLFSGSLRENLAFRHARLDDAELWEALRMADLDGFVRSLPGGLDSRLGERGVSLSGGQRQRLALARALLGRPQLLILDNCTSALDGDTEKRILTTLRESLRGRSAFIITHRAPGVLHCQGMAVLDAGRLAEFDDPQALLARPGYFKDIYAQQVHASA